MRDSSLDEPFIEIYFPTIDKAVNAMPGVYITLTSTVNPEKKIITAINKRSDDDVLMARAGAFAKEEFMIGESWAGSSPTLTTNGRTTALNLAFKADGSTPYQYPDESGAKITANKPFGIYFERVGQGGRYDNAVYMGNGRIGTRNLQINTGAAQNPYRYKVRSLSHDYGPEEPNPGLFLELSEEEASSMELSVTMQNIAAAGSDVTADIMVTSVKGVSLAGDDEAFGTFSLINGVEVTSPQGGSVQFENQLYLGDNTAFDKLVEIYVNPSTPGTEILRDSYGAIAASSYNPDFTQLTLTFSSPSTALTVVIGARERHGDCRVIMKAGGEGQSILGEQAYGASGIAEIADIPLNGDLCGELPFTFRRIFPRREKHQQPVSRIGGL